MLHKNSSIMNAIQLAHLFDNFLNRHVGNTDEDNNGLYVIDQDGILNNNLHKEDRSSSNGAPDGTATTEGQALMILGYLYMYAATEDMYWLNKAKYYTDAYVRHFYLRKPIPENPEVYRSHIYINGRAPFVTAGPNTWRKGSRTGRLEYDMDFVNGKGQVSHGYPDHGDEIIYIPFGFDGYLKWQSIVADVLKNGSTVEKGTVFNIEWYIDYRGFKVDPEGEMLSTTPSEPKGTVQLKEKVTGRYRINYASNNGSIIDRHQPFENWPIWIPTRKGEEGNAADAEEWFCDCAGLMYYFTKDEQYKRLYDCVIKTLEEISNVDQGLSFFRQDKNATTPFTDGISYEYAYSPNDIPITYSRNNNTGYIEVSKGTEPSPTDFTDVSLEQMASWFYVDNSSKINVAYGQTNDEAIGNFKLLITADATATKGSLYSYSVKRSTNDVGNYNVKLTDFIKIEDQLTGHKYYKLDGTSFVPYGNSNFTKVVGENIRVDADYRVDRYARVNFTSGSFSGIVCGFWSISATKNLPMQSITYRNTTGPHGALGSNCILAVKDADGVKWVLDLPHQPQFQTYVLSWNAAWRRADGLPGTIKPTNTLEQIEIQKNGPETTEASIDLYAWNGIPHKFNGKGTLKEFTLSVSCSGANTFYVGNCNADSGVNAGNINAPYTPGVIPFSTNFSVETQQVDGWRGIPYLGYQYPIIWGRETSNEERMNNMTKFMRDSQTDYHKRRNLKGPSSAAFVWPRWDNGSYGTFNTFVDLFWGTKEPWAGYYSRCMYGMCRLRYHLYKTGREANSDVVDFTEDWIDYLADFMSKNDNWTPTVFHSDKEPYTYDGDFTGHMSASFLAGACECYLAGSRNPNLEKVIEGIYTQFERELINLGPGQHMNGGYSVWAGGNYFFSVWTEILRGFGAYIMYQKKKMYGDSYIPPYE